MAGKLGKFQTLTFSHWRGLTKENHLGSIFQLAPQPASNMMVQLLSANKGKTLDSMLSRFPVKEFNDDAEYYWDIVSSSRRNIPLVEARDSSGNVVTEEGNLIGAGVEPFYLVFAEDYFADGETLEGELNELYQLRVLGEPREEGSRYVYKVELIGGNTTGMPDDQLVMGKRFSRGAAFVEKELSRGVGDVRFTSPIQCRNEWSTIRKKVKVPGSMLNKKLWCGIPVVNNKTGQKTTVDKWMHMVDYEFESEFEDEKNWALAWGRNNRTTDGQYLNFGKSGSSIKTGSGIFELMETANTQYWNTFSLKMIEDALTDLSAGKIPFGERYFVIRTGEHGATLFHKAVLNTISGWTQFTINGDNIGIVEKTSSVLHQNALSAGFQFTEFKAPNGVRVKLEVDPFYDDPVRNKIQHYLGGPAMSYRFDIMYLGSEDQPNIFKCKIKDKDDVKGYQWGLRNPFTGQVNNMNMSFDEDSAVMHKMSTFGAVVLDPTRTMSFIPAQLQG